MSLLGLDIGTTGCKAVALNEEGALLSGAYREYSLLHPKPGWVELDANLLWEKVKEVIFEVASKTHFDPIKALSVSTQGEAVVPIAKDGRPFYNFIISFDSRTESQCQWWQEKIGKEEIFQITGMPLHPMYTINKIMWLKENRPDIYRKAYKFLCVEDFVIFKLVAFPAIDYSLAARTMCFDIREKKWSEKILSLAGVSQELLSIPKPSGYPVGKINPRIAEELTLKKDVIVTAGGHDQPCGALGAGVVSPGLVMNAIGTSDVLCPAIKEPLLSKKMLANNYCCYPHTCPDMYTTISVNFTGGLLLKWYRDTFCFEEKMEAKRAGRDVYDIIVEKVSPEPVDVYVLPHFVGSGTPTLDSKSKGAILGLSIDTTKEDISRAILDSNNYDLRLNMDKLQQIGIPIEEIRTIGGGARSKKWLQLRADVLGKRVCTLKVSEAASLGAAILAGVGINSFTSPQEGARQWVKIDRVFEPDIKRHSQYRERYQNYLKIYPALKELIL